MQVRIYICPLLSLQAVSKEFMVDSLPKGDKPRRINRLNLLIGTKIKNLRSGLKKTERWIQIILVFGKQLGRAWHSH